MAKKKQTTAIQEYTLKSGEKRFMFQLYIGVDSLTGKEQRTTRRGFKTKKEAELALSRLKIEIDKGTYKKEIVETYQEVYNLWIAQYENTVAESTYVKTVRIFKNHILPKFGQYKIEKITAALCQSAVNEWFNKYAEYRTYKTYASKLFDFAIKHGYIQLNPMKLIELPRKNELPKDNEEVTENFYTKEELKQFLDCAKDINNAKAFAALRLLAYSGMRKGEALALTWNDINFKDCEIRINKALSRGKNSRLYVKSTKTGTSRTIKMDDVTLSTLEEWKKKQKQDYLILGHNTLQPKQLVFSNEKNTFLQPMIINDWMGQIFSNHKLKEITAHGLRHTHCSLLFEAGASLKEVQDRLGHSDIQTTMNIYTHVTEKAKEGAIQKFAAYLNS